jgi:hypothetical protein
MMHSLTVEGVLAGIIASNVGDIRTFWGWPHTVYSFLPFWLICYYLMPFGFGASGLFYDMFRGMIFYTFILPPC